MADFKLRNLSVGQMRIDEFEQVHLKVHASEVGVLSMDSFTPDLTSIDFAKCNLGANIRAGTFANFEHLSKVILANNSITTLAVGTFVNCSQLKHINLAHNLLQTIDAEVLGVGLALEILNLAHNRIEYLTSGAFAHVAKQLEQLDVSHNRITNISDSFVVLRTLQQLNLAHNRLTMLRLDAFDGLFELQSLNLSHNAIVVHELFLVQMPSLGALDVSYNQLTDLRIDFSQIGHRGEYNKLRVFVNGNHFTCAFLLAMSEAIKEQGVQIVRGDVHDELNVMGHACTHSPETTTEMAPKKVVRRLQSGKERRLAMEVERAQAVIYRFLLPTAIVALVVVSMLGIAIVYQCIGANGREALYARLRIR